MDSERWQWIQDLFHQAANLPPPGRLEFLNEACAADPLAMAEVLSLLEEESRGGSILDRSFASSAGLLLDAGPPALRQVGRYRLMKLLGEGGMGVVYLGERDDLDHQAAIKMLPDAWMSPARRGRFALEQRMLSRLNHRSIAQLYDAGTLDDGTPWFSMEYVEGLPITGFCAAHRLSVEQKLDLFRQVCEAVQYAHQQAVLHRDLKPANILVKPDRSVRLLDFGIAKPLDRQGDSLTRSGLAVATPAYAAPEQMEGKPAAVTADIYSLGVILRELLDGNPPDRDLEMLCGAATQREPGRRYQSAGALLRDVTNYREKRPLEARPDGPLYRAGKFIRRHRIKLAAACLVVAGALGMLLHFTLRLETARDQALAETARVQGIQRFLTQLFEGGTSAAGPSDDLRVVTLVDRGAREVRSLHADPATRGDLHHTLGTVYRNLGKHGQASEMLEASLEIRKSLDTPAGISESLTALSLLRQDQGKLEEAERLASESIDRARRFLPPAHPALRAAISALGRVQFDRGRYPDSVRNLETALHMIPDSASSAPERASTLERLSSARFYQSLYDESEKLARQSMAIYRGLYGDKHPRLAELLVNLGAIASQRSLYTESEAFYRQALEITEGYYGPAHPDVAIAWNGIGHSLIKQKRHDEAGKILDKVLEIRERAYGKVHLKVAATVSDLGDLAYMSDNLVLAEQLFRRMEDTYRRINGHNSHYVALAIANRASVHLDRKEFSAAEALYRQALEIYLHSLPADHFDIGVCRIKLGRSLVRQKRFAESAPESQAGLDIVLKHVREPSPWVNSARKDLVAAQQAGVIR